MNKAEEDQLDREMKLIASWAAGTIIKAFAVGVFVTCAVVFWTAGAWGYFGLDVLFLVVTLFLARSGWRRLQKAAS